MIQIITYDINGKNNFNNKLYKIVKFNELQALDDFEICIVDLCNINIWKYDGRYPTNVNCHKDLLTIGEAISSSNSSKIIIIFPTNIYYQYEKNDYDNSFYNTIQMKDNKENFLKIIRDKLLNIETVKISFEKTVTSISGKKVKADFNFSEHSKEYNVITTSESSNKVTTIQKNRVFLTTLNLLESEENLNLFIENYCKSMHEKEKMPEWIKKIKFYNDNKLDEEINNNNEEIQKLRNMNIELEEQLNKNLEYKSILYTNGDELVRIVLEILDEILEYDSNEFVDEKREDFLIKKEDITFVGEIKGLSSAVQNKNISQLEVHVQNYFDKLQEEGKTEKIKGLLIINHQRNKPLEERQEIHEHQRNLAIRYGSLIIETQTLLRVYEKYKLGNLTKEDCKKMFENNTGILKI